jgi:hypothetical protein
MLELIILYYFKIGLTLPGLDSTSVLSTAGLSYSSND